MADNGTCKLHSGFDERIKDLESNKTELWKKWDRMNALLIATLGGVIVNLLLMLIKMPWGVKP
jgi:hypothetical protein